MSKKFSLIAVKEWLTLADTAKHLAILFGEDVTESDVLQIALDGRITLSVNFVNASNARPGTICPIELVEPTVSELMGQTISHYPGRVIVDGDGKKKMAFKPADEIVNVHGLYDLPMIGHEVLAVQQAFHSAKTGVHVAEYDHAGLFVCDGKTGDMYQLQTSNDDNYYTVGSRAFQRRSGRASEEDIVRFGLESEIDERQSFLTAQASLPIWEQYSAAMEFPKGALFVVRTAVLRDFEKALANNQGDDSSVESSGQATQIQSKQQKAGASKIDHTINKIIFGLAVGGYGYDETKPRSEAIKQMITDLKVAVGITLDATTLRKYLKNAAEDCRR